MTHSIEHYSAVVYAARAYPSTRSQKRPVKTLGEPLFGACILIPSAPRLPRGAKSEKRPRKQKRATCRHQFRRGTVNKGAECSLCFHVVVEFPLESLFYVHLSNLRIGLAQTIIGAMPRAYVRCINSRDTRIYVHLRRREQGKIFFSPFSVVTRVSR